MILRWPGKVTMDKKKLREEDRNISAEMQCR